MAMTKEERELGGIEFPPDSACQLSPLDREDYLNGAFQGLENPAIAKLLADYDLELVALLIDPARERSTFTVDQLPACYDCDPYEGSDADITWFDRQMYLDYAFQRLIRPEMVRLLKHCESELVRDIQSAMVADIAN